MAFMAPPAHYPLQVVPQAGGDIKQLPLELSNFLGALPPPRSLTGPQVLLTQPSKDASSETLQSSVAQGICLVYQGKCIYDSAPVY